MRVVFSCGSLDACPVSSAQWGCVLRLHPAHESESWCNPRWRCFSGCVLLVARRLARTRALFFFGSRAPAFAGPVVLPVPVVQVGTVRPSRAPAGRVKARTPFQCWVRAFACVHVFVCAFACMSVLCLRMSCLFLCCRCVYACSLPIMENVRSLLHYCRLYRDLEVTVGLLRACAAGPQ